MPIIKAAIKDLRQAEKRRAANRRQKNNLKFALKDMQKLVAAKKTDELKKRLPEITALIDKAVKKHLLHKNTAARKKSSFARFLAAK